MIKYSAQKVNGGNVLGFGLTARNVELLKQGKPIHIFLAEIIPNSKDEVLICYGETEETIRDDFLRAGLITEKTIVKD